MDGIILETAASFVGTDYVVSIRLRLQSVRCLQVIKVEVLCFSNNSTVLPICTSDSVRPSTSPYEFPPFEYTIPELPRYTIQWLKIINQGRRIK